MIVYLDTCTILNLIQSNYSEKYLLLLEKIFDQIKVVPVVLEELRANKFINVNEDDNKKIIDLIIFDRVIRYLDSSNSVNVLNFTKKHNLMHFKDNGESHSIGYILQASRYGDGDFGEFLMKTHFATDDDPAKEDFCYFSNINLLGKFIDSIDLMTLFWLRNFITKNELLKYCFSLRLLYNKEVGLLIQELTELKNRFQESFNSAEHIFLTSFVEGLYNVDDNLSCFIRDITKNKIYKKIKSKNIESLVNALLVSSIGKKINYINKRIEDLKMVWVIE